jgi:methylated-DNA-protein-cysteine methyltransferase-like protein
MPRLNRSARQSKAVNESSEPPIFIDNRDIAAIHAFVRTIPAGFVMTYGEVGRAAGGYGPRLVGRAMAGVPEDVPWQRVVGAGGVLRIARRAPELGLLQRNLLEREGVRFTKNGRIEPDFLKDGDG